MASNPKPLTLRVKSKKSQNGILRDVIVSERVQTLLTQLSALTDIPQEEMAILKGFPPKRLYFDPADTIESLGLQHQDTIIVELKAHFDGEEAVFIRQPRTSSQAGSSTRPRTPTNNVSSSPTSNGQSVSTPRANHSSSEAEAVPSGANDVGLLLRHVVPSDNSCLFTSVSYCVASLPNLTGTGATFLRQMIATTVAADPVKFNEAFLGRPNRDYCAWIKKPESWGGGIEISILAEFYRLQISVVDTQSLNISNFGEDHEFSRTIFIIYDGIHYDPLFLEPFSGGSAITIFDTSNRNVVELAKQLAKEANASSQFTDVKNFSLRCTICNKLLTGEEEAQAHAKQTAHTSFAEIKK